MNEVRLGIDVACRAAHQASLADETGRFLWQGWKFRTTTSDLDTLWAKIGDEVTVVVVMEPTRNAWVPLAAWFRAKGAAVSVVPPEQSADLRDYYNKHTKTDRLDSKMLARMPMLHPEGLRTVDNSAICTLAAVLTASRKTRISSPIDQSNEPRASRPGVRLEEPCRLSRLGEIT